MIAWVGYRNGLLANALAGALENATYTPVTPSIITHDDEPCPETPAEYGKRKPRKRRNALRYRP